MARRSFELSCMMREDLLMAYRNVYATCRTQKEAYQKTVRSPAPRFYVTPKQAWERLRHMVVGDFTEVDQLNELYKKMYYELFEKMQILSQRKEFFGKSLWFICQFLVSQPASQFFITPETFSDIFQSIRKYGKEYHFKETRRKFD